MSDSVEIRFEDMDEMNWNPDAVQQFVNALRANPRIPNNEESRQLQYNSGHSNSSFSSSASSARMEVSSVVSSGSGGSSSISNSSFRAPPGGFSPRDLLGRGGPLSGGSGAGSIISSSGSSGMNVGDDDFSGSYAARLTDLPQMGSNSSRSVSGTSDSGSSISGMLIDEELNATIVPGSSNFPPSP